MKQHRPESVVGGCGKDAKGYFSSEIIFWYSAFSWPKSFGEKKRTSVSYTFSPK
jgi:hypothetical protein